jgi:hypothetical protein
MIALSTLLVVGTSWLYYFRLDTLTLSEVLEKSENPYESFLRSDLDFDTGLTRYDIRILKTKREHWSVRFENLGDIVNYDEYNRELSIMIDEMKKDPQMKKVANLINQRGMLLVYTVLELI